MEGNSLSDDKYYLTDDRSALVGLDDALLLNRYQALTEPMMTKIHDEVEAWMSNYIPLFNVDVITYP